MIDHADDMPKSPCKSDLKERHLFMPIATSNPMFEAFLSTWFP